MGAATFYHEGTFEEGHDLKPCGFDRSRLPVNRHQHIRAALFGGNHVECVQLRLEVDCLR